MVQWYKVTMVQWYNGTIVQWYHGTMVQRGPWYNPDKVRLSSVHGHVDEFLPIHVKTLAGVHDGILDNVFLRESAKGVNGADPDAVRGED